MKGALVNCMPKPPCGIMLFSCCRGRGPKLGSEWARLSALLNLWEVHYLKNGLLGAQVAIQHLHHVLSCSATTDLNVTKDAARATQGSVKHGH